MERTTHFVKFREFISGHGHVTIRRKIVLFGSGAPTIPDDAEELSDDEISNYGCNQSEQTNQLPEALDFLTQVQERVKQLDQQLREARELEKEIKNAIVWRAMTDKLLMPAMIRTPLHNHFIIDDGQYDGGLEIRSIYPVGQIN